MRIEKPKVADLRDDQIKPAVSSKFAMSEMMNKSRQRMSVLTGNGTVLPIQKRVFCNDGESFNFIKHRRYHKLALWKLRQS